MGKIISQKSSYILRNFKAQIDRVRLYNVVSIAQRSTRQACWSILCQLFAQDLPNLRWGGFNKVEVNSIILYKLRYYSIHGFFYFTITLSTLRFTVGASCWPRSSGWEPLFWWIILNLGHILLTGFRPSTK